MNVFIDSKCKFCQRPLRLEVDEDYSKLGDPYNLMPLASCNACADYRTEARLILEGVRRRCVWIAQGLIDNKELREKVENRLRVLLSQYMALLAKHWAVPLPEFDPAIVDALMSRPTEFSKIIRQIPKMYQQKTML